MSIYTKMGDTGKTSLLNERVSKSNIRIETNGNIDELLVKLAFLIEEIKKLNSESILNNLYLVYRNLFIIQSAIADSNNSYGYNVKDSDIKKLESEIDLMDEVLPKLKNFISYTGAHAAMLCHDVRAKVRTVERLIVSVYEDQEINNLILMYINRLSDYLYTLARFINLQSGVEEEILKL